VFRSECKLFWADFVSEIGLQVSKYDSFVNFGEEERRAIGW